MATLIPWRGKAPVVAADAFVAPNATLIGDCEIADQASIWFGVTLRADVEKIRVGARSNIQDGSVVHVTTDRWPTIIGADVLIGHLVLLHGCVIEDTAFIGMRATVMDGAVIEGGAMVAAGALISPGKRVRRGEVWAGSPAKLWRSVTDDDLKAMKYGPAHYVDLAMEYRAVLEAPEAG